MKVKKFKELNEAEISQIPQTQLHKYFQYYKMWCDQNGQEYNFNEIDNEDKLRNIIYQGYKYAEEHNLPNIYYNRDDD